MVQINARLLKAVATAMSSEETRYYLKGVHVQFGPSGFTLCATDGHRMIVARQDYQPDEQPRDDQYIIPARIINTMKIGARSQDYATLTIGDNKLLTLTLDGIGASEGAIEGTFPAYARVVPRTINNAVGQYDPEYLFDFQKAMKIVGIKAGSPVVYHNGLDPALVNWLPDNHLAGVKAFGVIMPFRQGKMFEKAPSIAWACGEEAAIAA